MRDIYKGQPARQHRSRAAGFARRGRATWKILQPLVGELREHPDDREPARLTQRLGLDLLEVRQVTPDPGSPEPGERCAPPRG